MTRRANRAGTGSASVTVHGTNMGLVMYTARAHMGGSRCEATDWESETSLRCLMGHGAKGTRRVVMTLGERAGSASSGWSVDLLSVSSIRRINRAGTGSSSLTVHGANMGMIRHTVNTRVGHSGCESTDWESETSMRCRVHHGRGGTRRVMMTAGTRGGECERGDVV